MVHILLIGAVLIVCSAVFHVSVLVSLARLLPRLALKVKGFGSFVSVIFLIAVAVIVIIGIHTVEIWAWAGVYFALGEFSEFDKALYFSAVTATTLGYGDIVLSEYWQLLSTFEAMGGLILFGASTAFLLALMRKLFDEGGIN